MTLSASKYSFYYFKNDRPSPTNSKRSILKKRNDDISNGTIPVNQRVSSTPVEVNLLNNRMIK